MKQARKDFLEELGGYFGYEIKSGQELRETIESDYPPDIRYESLMKFIIWYDKQLGRMNYKQAREDFIEELSGYFGYEIKSGEELKEKIESDYPLGIRYESLMKFIISYDKHLGR